MSNYGFKINKIAVTGFERKTAEISFCTGLNVITGPSNTGKSYILQCIDFMFGSDTPPKDIKESNGYTTVFMEIEDYNKNIYTLERSISGGNYNLYDTSFENSINEKPIRQLKSRHNEKGGDISSFLLSLCNIGKVKIKSNENNEIKNLTFRLISHLFVVSESRIIADYSPILLQNGYSVTKSKSAFNYLLTNINESNLDQNINKDTIKIQNSAMLVVYDNLIERLERKVESLSKSLSYEELITIEEKINHVGEQIDSINKKIHDKQKTREEIWGKQKQIESEIIVNTELLNRFELLDGHYQSDINRLEFIIEGEHFLGQLVAVNCPLCGSLLGEHSCDRLYSEREGFINIKEACNAEARKIQVQMRDLHGTILSLRLQNEKAKSIALQYGAEIKNIEKGISESLSPQILMGKKELDQLVAIKEGLSELEYSKDRIDELIELRQQIEIIADTPTSKTSTQINVGAIRELCDEIQGILKEWGFIDKEHVEFNQHYKKLDFIIGGIDRQSNGKGVRALTHSAFNIGLMSYCINRELPHPRLVVLDSPLTTYKESVGLSSNDEVNGNVQKQFFSWLSKLQDNEQVIIFENKEPEQKIKDRIHYIEFVGENQIGRVGFFPPA